MHCTIFEASALGHRSQTDCGEVENSDEARSLDEPVLRAELDLDKLAEEQP